MNNLYQSFLNDNVNDNDIGLEIMNQTYGHLNINELCKYHDLTSYNNLSLKHRNHLKILHMNARNITNKFDSLMAFLSSLAIKPNVLCISETWLNKSNKDLYNLQGYTPYHMVRNTDTGGGGVSVFCLQ